MPDPTVHKWRQTGLARALGVHRNTVRNMILRDELAVTGAGRVLLTEAQFAFFVRRYGGPGELRGKV